jgi:hypothetical protein
MIESFMSDILKVSRLENDILMTELEKKVKESIFRWSIIKL